MFIEKYLSQDKIKMLYEVYDKNYIKSINKDNFGKIYKILDDNNFYFIDDIILNCLELFEYDEKYVSNMIKYFKKEYGKRYVYNLGNDISLINKYIDEYKEIDEYGSVVRVFIPGDTDEEIMESNEIGFEIELEDGNIEVIEKQDEYNASIRREDIVHVVYDNANKRYIVTKEDDE